MPDKFVLDGEIVEGTQVSLGIKSEGFSFGFGLFETLKFENQRPCFLKEHFNRLVKSAEAISMRIPFSADEIFRQSVALFEANSVKNGVYKILVSRSENENSTVVYIRDSTRSITSVPVRLRLSSVVKSSQAFTTNHKTLNYLENLLEKRLAEQHGFDECLFCNEAGFVTECGTANLFVIREDLLKTPSVDCGLLGGVIRGQVLRIARELGMRVEEGNLLPGECAEADEAFITSSGKGLVGVSEIWTGRSKIFSTINSKLVRTLDEQLRTAEIASTEIFET